MTGDEELVAAEVSADAALDQAIDQAIAKRTCIQAIYNKVPVTLAPHSLFIKNDAPHLRAVTIEHDGRKPREAKLGTFRLSGLSEVRPTRKLFSRSIFPAETSAD